MVNDRKVTKDDIYHTGVVVLKKYTTPKAISELQSLQVNDGRSSPY